MRLFLWVLLVALVTLLTSADALSADPDTKQESQLAFAKAVALRVLAADYDLVNGKRSLRGENEKDEGEEEEEERTGRIFVKFKGSLERLKVKLREVNPFSAKNIEKQYLKRAKEGTTPDTFLKECLRTLWPLRRWKKKSYEKFNAWYTTKYDPKWVSKIDKKK